MPEKYKLDSKTKRTKNYSNYKYESMAAVSLVDVLKGK